MRPLTRLLFALLTLCLLAADAAACPRGGLFHRLRDRRAEAAPTCVAIPATGSYHMPAAAHPVGVAPIIQPFTDRHYATPYTPPSNCPKGKCESDWRSSPPRLEFPIR